MEEPQTIKGILFQSLRNMIMRHTEYIFTFIGEPQNFASAWFTFDYYDQSVLSVNILFGNSKGYEWLISVASVTRS